MSDTNLEAEHKRMNASLVALALTIEITKGLLTMPEVIRAPAADRLELVTEGLDELAKLVKVGLGQMSEEEYSAGKDDALTDAALNAAREALGG